MQTPKKTLFETSVGISGPEGPETPVNGRSGRNKWRLKSQEWLEILVESSGLNHRSIGGSALNAVTRRLLNAYHSAENYYLPDPKYFRIMLGKPENAKGGVQNVLFPQGGAYRIANSSLREAQSDSVKK